MQLTEHDPRFSPSSSARWLTCTASVEEVAKLPPDKGSTYAHEGTVAHEVFEQEVTRYLMPIQTPIPEGKHADEHTEAMRKHAIESVEFLSEGCLPSESGHTVIRQAEARVHIPVTGGFGTADFIDLTDGLLTVADYKYGQGEMVDAKGNTQLMLYALGAYDIAQMMDWEVNKVQLVILQPRRENFDTHCISVMELLEFETNVREATARAKQSGVPFINGGPEYAPSESACRWCPLKATCTALRDHVFDAMSGHFEDLDAEPMITAGDMDDLGTVMDQAYLFEIFIRAVREEAHVRLEQGKDVLGWKLVEGRSIRKWTDEEEARTVMRKQRRVKANVWSPPKIISPAQAAKLNFSNPTRLLLRVVTDKPKGKPTLARESDKRPVYRAATEEEFEDEK